MLERLSAIPADYIDLSRGPESPSRSDSWLSCTGGLPSFGIRRNGIFSSCQLRYSCNFRGRMGFQIHPDRFPYRCLSFRIAAEHTGEIVRGLRCCAVFQ